MISQAISSNDIARGAVNGLIVVYKKLGETPLACLQRLKLKYPELANTPLSYAGRLDPLAEGVLLVLSGDFNNRREEFLGLDKSYIVEVLFGVSTDTGDVLGLPVIMLPHTTVFKNSDIEQQLRAKFIGVHEFPYPSYSSKTVQGKALHEWAREGKLDEIDIPTTVTRIFDIEILDKKIISAAKITEKVSEKIALVQGDFRQEAIIASWNEFSEKNISNTYEILTIRVDTASGAYMRTLAEEIGEYFDTNALAFSIKRAKVGDFGIENCIDL